MIKNRRRWIWLLALTLGLLIAAKSVWEGIHRVKGEDTEKEKEKEPDLSKLKTLALADSQIIMQHITFAVAGPATLKNFLSLPGEIALNGEKVLRLSPRFAGMVKEVRVKLGDKVEKGQTLAILESNESLSSYEMKAPISGILLEKNIKVGELARENDTTFVLVDLSSVWVEFHVYPRDISMIHPGMIISVGSSEGFSENAKVTFVGLMADRETRTIPIRAEMSNRANAWRPGLFVQCHILKDSSQVPVAVPFEALQSLEGKPCVFMKTPNGLRPVFAEAGISDGEKTEIKSDLALGDTVVAGNAYLIKSEFEKASFEGDEGNEEKEQKEKD